MKVFTYFNHVGGLQDPGLLELWKASWSRYGWEPVILSEADAVAADPGLVARFRQHPLLQSHPGNPAGYVLACLLRYVPMTRVTEPCLHCDWDIMCNGYTPTDVPKHPFPLVFLAGCYCPCAMFGSPAAWRMITAIVEGSFEMDNFDPAKLRTDNADQYVTGYQMPADWARIDPTMPCKTYLEHADWRSAPMIHFPNRLVGYPRSDKIKRLGFIG